jgi:hypothetical protein
MCMQYVVSCNSEVTSTVFLRYSKVIKFDSFYNFQAQDYDFLTFSLRMERSL